MATSPFPATRRPITSHPPSSCHILTIVLHCLLTLVMGKCLRLWLLLQLCPRRLVRMLWVFHCASPIHLSTCKHTHTHACMHARTHTRTHARMHARTHPHTHTRTHARTQTSSLFTSWSPSAEHLPYIPQPQLGSSPPAKWQHHSVHSEPLILFCVRSKQSSCQYAQYQDPIGKSLQNQLLQTQIGNHLLLNSFWAL